MWDQMIFQDENDSPLKKPASFTSEVQSFALNIWLKEGHDLVIRDSCGNFIYKDY